MKHSFFPGKYRVVSAERSELGTTESQSTVTPGSCLATLLPLPARCQTDVALLAANSRDQQTKSLADL